MPYTVTPTIEWGLARDIALAARRLSELTAIDRWETVEKGGGFVGCLSRWRIEQLKDVPDDETDERSTLQKLLDLFRNRNTYGLSASDDDTEVNLSQYSPNELAAMLESAIPETDEGLAAFPILQLLTVIVPIILEIIKRLDD